MNFNKKTQKKYTENEQIKKNYNAWVKSGKPAKDILNNTELPQDSTKPYKRCYNGHDKINKQLPKQWYIREDKTLITFKKGREILDVPHVVHINPYMDRPCYAIRLKTENGYTTKQIADYTLVTIVWHPERIYGNARKLLEESLHDNLGKRDKLRNKAHGHHTGGRDNDRVVIEDTPAHVFCHSAPNTDKTMEFEKELAFNKELGKIAEQEPNKLTVFRKWENNKDCKNGELTAHDNVTLEKEELTKKYIWEDRKGNAGLIDIVTILQNCNINNVTVVDKL